MLSFADPLLFDTLFGHTFLTHFFPLTLYTGLFDETAAVIGYFASDYSLRLGDLREVIFGKNDKLTIYTGQADATGMVAENYRGVAAQSLFCFRLFALRMADRPC